MKSLSLGVCVFVVASLWMVEAKADESGQSPTSATDPMIGKEPGQVRDDNGLKMKLVWCPAGKFTMGSPATELGNSGKHCDDEDQASVTLTKGFWLGKYEVTQAQYEQVMGTNPSDFSPGGSFSSRVKGQQTAQLPIENVSWEESREFCKKFTEQERKAGRLPAGWEYTLPTEAQWEYACRAGTSTPFSFGKSLNGDQANFDGNYPYGTSTKGTYLHRTMRVGSYEKNAWGLYDMHGNVCEWCLDAYQGKLHDGNDPLASDGPDRVVRGGGWEYHARDCRSACRSGYSPDGRLNFLGFRLARSPVRPDK